MGISHHLKAMGRKTGSRGNAGVHRQDLRWILSAERLDKRAADTLAGTRGVIASNGALVLEGKTVTLDAGQTTASKLTFTTDRGDVIDSPISWKLKDGVTLDLTPGNAPDRFNLRLRVDGASIAYELRANSAFNPFKSRVLSGFSLPERL